MLLSLILGIFFAIPKIIISNLPYISFTFPTDFIDAATVMFANIGFFLPMNQLMPIIVFGLTLDNIHIFWTIALRIKSFIPTMGS